jgi:hypothetical protein
MILSYWYSECLDDHTCYSVREASRKEVIRILTEEKMLTLRKVDDGEIYASDDWQSRFAVPHKVTVEYSNGLDLLKQCLGEGGIYEGKD